MRWSTAPFPAKIRSICLARHTSRGAVQTREGGVTVHLGKIGQIAIPVADADRSEEFYENTLGLPKLYRFGDLVFFDCGGVRLMLSGDDGEGPVASEQAIYFVSTAIERDHNDLAAAGVAIEQAPQLVAPMPDHDLWMAFFRDPDGHLLGLMQELPKGEKPA